MVGVREQVGLFPLPDVLVTRQGFVKATALVQFPTLSEMVAVYVALFGSVTV